jgi:DNA topoisomerase I
MKPEESTANLAADAPAAARAAGLRYVVDTRPGLARIPLDGGGFRYVDARGEPVDDEATLGRIRSLAIPPAWRDVWICAQANGHLQATGRDARGRKQYRYHPRWRSVRDEVKYERMIAFGRALPGIRRTVDAALSLPGLPREKVLATIVYLLEATMMRIGNEEYAKENKSFGLTTLRNRHVRIDGKEVEFRFRGKSGVWHDVKVEDRRLARIIARTRDLPGQELFQYVDDDGNTHAVDSSDVNDYLRTITGEDYTAKDFRTWSGTVLAALALQEFEKFDSETQAKKNVVRAIESVAKKLGNTPSVCRKCYVHPAVLEAYMDGTEVAALRTRAEQELSEDLHALQPEEAAVMALLQQRLEREAEQIAAKGKAAPKPATTRRAKAKDGAKSAAKPTAPAVAKGAGKPRARTAAKASRRTAPAAA